jgi:hypothetical protein
MHPAPTRSFASYVFALLLAVAACSEPKPQLRSTPMSTSTIATASPSAPARANVFFFGHSLVGHDLPQMIGSFARARGKSYGVHGQVGFGTPLMSHWRWQGSFDSGFVPPGFRDELPGSLLFDVDGHKALESGAYDVVVLTETNGFAEGSPGNWSTRCDPSSDFGGCTIDNVANLVRLARQHNASVRVLLYASWKNIEELGGVDKWLADVEATAGWWDYTAQQVDAKLAGEGVNGSAIVVVPAAKILARIVREADAGQLAAYGVANREPLFRDPVHLNPLGFYIIALAHYAMIFGDSPIGLPSKVDIVSDDKKTLVAGGLELEPKLAAHFQQVVFLEIM